MEQEAENRKIITAGEEKLQEDPDDTATYFSMAMAYESLGEYEKAITHNSKCLEKLPKFFFSLTLAARCKSKLLRYDEAYTYAQAALRVEAAPGYPDLAVKVFKLMSYIPGLKPLRSLNEETIRGYEKDEKWLKKYVAWYESK